MAYTPFCVLGGRRSASGKVRPVGLQPSEGGFTFIPQGSPGYSGDSFVMRD